ncbi:MAG: DUF1294 domain-containing protein [Planctomycetes bacterium]|nr:DUF1294 domain-containing protein [Planctomycetota bacterium]
MLGGLSVLILFTLINVGAFVFYVVDKRMGILRGDNAFFVTVVIGVLGGGLGMYLACRKTRHFTQRFGSTLLFLAFYGVTALHIGLSWTSSLGQYFLTAALWQLGVSVFALMLVAYDKKAAGEVEGPEGRIAERDFVYLSAFGGYGGVLYGFKSLRHKTLHRGLVTRVNLAGIAGLIAVVLIGLY